ncbi:hypothetical protein OIU77_030324 [Salix suchowensis]|uniref:Uncharacterized protein n=1 Tax=Salix suchowensis TaxID=1278906 RepID=A0ABQ9BBH6_9ROSI|nr:hypothetical protein OIU77_030324 [Salix suchowensis]
MSCEEQHILANGGGIDKEGSVFRAVDALHSQLFQGKNNQVFVLISLQEEIDFAAQEWVIEHEKAAVSYERFQNLKGADACAGRVRPASTLCYFSRRRSIWFMGIGAGYST